MRQREPRTSTRAPVDGSFCIASRTLARRSCDAAIRASRIRWRFLYVRASARSHGQNECRSCNRMNAHSSPVEARMRSLAWTCGCLLVAARLSAPDVQPPAESQPVAPGGPTLQFRGFADINFSGTSDRRSDDGRTVDGFTLGNFVGHVSSSLGGKFSFYAEVIVEA